MLRIRLPVSDRASASEGADERENARIAIPVHSWSTTP
jgi:hypothetical protein